ncbi:MAG: hypothetical protein ACNYPH_02765 [Gammaproteobacteria bacterium WSBS_2016_MAG_OTU1]
MNFSLYSLSLLSPLFVAAMSLPGAPGVLAGVAAGLHIIASAEKQKWRAVAAALVLLFLSWWLALPAICLLAGVYVSEALLAESWRLRVGRLFAAVLCLQIILFTINVDSSLTAAHTPIAFGLAAAAVLCAGGRRAVLDPLLCALFSLLLISFALTVKLIYLQIGSYSQAAVATSAGFCAALAIVHILLSPLRDGSGFQSLTRAFALEVPLESWIDEISAVAEREKNADDFLYAVAAQLSSKLPGVDGIRWHAEDGESQQIGDGKYTMKVVCAPLTMVFYRRRFASPWTWFNHYLLCRIVGEYYQSKRREEEQRTQNLLQIVHQTGARLTHDIKNILHALAALTATEDDALVRRQLPILRQRLETALNKLRTVPKGDVPTIPAAVWWEEARTRHLHMAATFVESDATAMLPPTLFDRALDNFLENARRKQSLINVSLSSYKLGVILRVEDSGDKIASETVKKLFNSPLPSADGFGISLYQLAREATLYDYQVMLENNATGKVVFVMRPVDK